MWFEHFAIDKNSNKSPFGDKYVDEHDKKIKFHEENRTNFVCTYMSDYYSDNLLSLIDNFLNNYNLAKNPISDEEIEENIKNIYRNNVLTLVREEIKLFKASQTNIEDAKEKISQLPDKFRSSRFLEIFLPLYEEYQSYLKETESIDFEDMIKNAVEIVDKTRRFSRIINTSLLMNSKISQKVDLIYWIKASDARSKIVWSRGRLAINL